MALTKPSITRSHKLPTTKKCWTWLENYRIPRTKKYCSRLRITQDKETLHMAGNYQIPKRKKYWTWLGITWYRYPRGKNTAPGWEEPNRKKYWTWLGITQEYEILDLTGNYPRGRNTGPGWESWVGCRMGWASARVSASLRASLRSCAAPRRPVRPRPRPGCDSRLRTSSPSPELKNRFKHDVQQKWCENHHFFLTLAPADTLTYNCLVLNQPLHVQNKLPVEKIQFCVERLL